MLAKLGNFWQILRGTLWFVPAVFCLAAILAVLAIHALEIWCVPERPKFPALIYSGSMEDAQRLIEALLSSMITMTTLVISITVVVLSLASSQLGPRLIKAFMSDRLTQVYIGLFFGAILACFMVLMILYDSDLSGKQTPQLTVSFLALYVFANLFVLLFFVHHVAESCIADRVIERVSGELMAAIDRLPKKNGKDVLPPFVLPDDFEDRRKIIHLPCSGYVQTIDYDGLVAVAAREDILIRLQFRSGTFLVAGQMGIEVYPADGLDDRCTGPILSCIVLGSQRTPTQDLEYSMRHLVEIALRALSPGINDPFTAETVIDHLSRALGNFFSRRKRLNVYYDKQNSLRVAGMPITDEDLVNMAYDQIRRAGKNRTDIPVHLLHSIRNIAVLAKNDDQRQALRQQARIIFQQINAQSVDPYDYDTIRHAFRETAQALA